jgi:hypothetical protein
VIFFIKIKIKIYGYVIDKIAPLIPSIPNCNPTIGLQHYKTDRDGFKMIYRIPAVPGPFCTYSRSHPQILNFNLSIATEIYFESTKIAAAAFPTPESESESLAGCR